MGISKAMMEKVVVAFSRGLVDSDTVICCTRYGNVMGSRGSVIPLFVDQLVTGKPITVTDPEMTRFMMTLDDAVELVFFAFENGNNGDIFVQKAPAATVKVLIQALSELLGKPNHPISNIGTRHGEKLYESLLGTEERASAIDFGQYFKISPDLRDLNYSKFVEKGELSNTINSHNEDYNSHNTTRLNIVNMKAMLLKLNFIQRIVRGEKNDFNG
jgi:UDP-glucose 4-epimerase